MSAAFDDTPRTAMEIAFRAAEAVLLAEEMLRQQVAEAKALEDAALHVYNPRPYPEAEPTPLTMYEGTGVGFLYGVPGSECFAPQLGDWRLGKEPKVSPSSGGRA